MKPTFTCPSCGRTITTHQNRFGDLLLAPHKPQTWESMHGKRQANYINAEDVSDLEMLSTQSNCNGSGQHMGNVHIQTEAE